VTEGAVMGWQGLGWQGSMRIATNLARLRLPIQPKLK